MMTETTCPTRSGGTPCARKRMGAAATRLASLAGILLTAFADFASASFIATAPVRDYAITTDVREILVSPDGSELILVRYDKAHVYDAVTFEHKRVFEFDSLVSHVVLSPDGRFIYFGGGNLRAIFDYETGEIVRVPEQAGAAAAFSPDGTRFAVNITDEPGHVQVQDTLTGEVLLDIRRGDSEPAYSTTKLAYSPDGKTLAMAHGYDEVRFVRLHDAATGAVLHETAVAALTRDVRFSSDSTRIAVLGYDTLQVISAKGGAMQTIDIPVAAHAREGTAEFCLDDEFVVFMGRGFPQAMLVDLANGEITRHFVARNRGSGALAVLPGAIEALVSTQLGGVYRIDLETGDVLDELHPEVIIAINAIDVRESADGQHVDALFHWTVATYERSESRRISAQPFLDLSTGSSSGVSVILGPSQRAALYQGSEIAVYDLETGERLHQTADIPSTVLRMAALDTGRMLATGTYVDVQVWDAEAGGLLRTWSGLGGQHTVIAGAENAPVLAAGTADSRVHVLDPGSEAAATVFEGHRETAGGAVRIDALALSADGTLAASADSQRNVFVWDVAAGTVLQRLRLRQASDWLAFSPDNQLLATGGEPNYTVDEPTSAFVFPRAIGTLWDVGTGEPVQFLSPPMHPYGYYVGARFSADGQRLYAWGDVWEGRVIEEWTVAPHPAANRWIFHDPPGDVLTTESRATIDYLPDGSALFTTCEATSEIGLWDAVTGDRVYKRAISKPPVAAAVSPDGARAAVVHRSSVSLCDTASGALLHTLQAPSEANLTKAVFSPTGRHLLAANLGTGGALLWDAETGDLLRTFNMDMPVHQVAYGGDGRIVVTYPAVETDEFLSEESGIRAWDPARAYVVDPDDGGMGAEFQVNITLNFTGMEWVPYQAVVISSFGTFESLTRARNADTGETLALARNPSTMAGYPALDQLSFDATGTVFASTRRGSVTGVWDTGRFEIQSYFTNLVSGPGAGRSADVALSPDASRVALMSIDGRVTVFDTGLSTAYEPAVEPLEPGVPTTWTMDLRGPNYFQFDVDASGMGAYRLRLEPGREPDHWALAAGHGMLPAIHSAPWQGTGPDADGHHELLMAAPQPGAYYVAVAVAPEGLGQFSGTLLLEQVEPVVTGLSQTAGGNRGAIDLSITGSGFYPGVRVELRDESGGVLRTYTPLHTALDRIDLLLDLEGIAPQTAAIAVVRPDGAELAAPEPFAVYDGVGPRFTLRCIVPPETRPGLVYTGYVECVNTGDANAAAPLIQLDGGGALLAEHPDGPFRTGVLQFLPFASAPPDTAFRPGDRADIPFYFTPAGDSGYLYFSAAEVALDDTLIDWTVAEARIRPDGYSDAEWATVFAALQATFGDTAQSYYNALESHLLAAADAGHAPPTVTQTLWDAAESALERQGTRIVGEVVDADSGGPAAAVRVWLLDVDGTGAWTARTDATGQFVFESVPQGVYQFEGEGWHVIEGGSISIVEPVPVMSVRLRIAPRAMPRSEPASLYSENTPSFGHGVGEVPILVWEQYNAIWHAAFDAESRTWIEGGRIPNARGREPALAVAERDSALLLVAVWQSLPSPEGITFIEYAVGRWDASFTWSAPHRLTHDTASDARPTVVFEDGASTVEIAFQQRGGPDDDTGLYTLRVDVDELWQSLPDAAGSDAPGTAGDSDEPAIAWAEGFSPFGTLDILGGAWRLQASAPLAADSIGPSMEGTAQLSVTHQDHAVLEGSGPFAAVFSDESPMRNTALMEFDLSRTVSHSVPGLPLGTEPYPLHMAAVELTTDARAEGTLWWNGPFRRPSAVSRLDFSLEGTISGLTAAPSDSAGGPMEGSYTAELHYNPADGLHATAVDLFVSGSAPAYWDGLQISWTLTAGDGVDATLFSQVVAAGGATMVEDDAEVIYRRADYVDTSHLRIPRYREWVFTPGHAAGTGQVHEGHPLDPDGATNTVSDHSFVLSTHLATMWNGPTWAAWVRNTPSETGLGGQLVSNYNPAEPWYPGSVVRPGPALIRDLTGGEDRKRLRYLVWSEAPADELPLDAPVPDILAAAAASDIWSSYSGYWTDAGWWEPTLVAVLPGADILPVLGSAGPQSRAFPPRIVWWNLGDGYRLFTARWSGEEWSALEQLTQAAAAGKAAIYNLPSIDSPVETVVVWPQDADGQSDTRDDWRLHYLYFDGTTWSESLPLAPDLTMSNGEPTAGYAPAGKQVGDAYPRSGGPAPSHTQPGPLPVQLPVLSEGGAEEPVAVEGTFAAAAKASTRGAGVGRYIAAGDPITYTIHVSNPGPNPLQSIEIRDELDPNLDGSSVRFTGVGWGDTAIALGRSASVYSLAAARDVGGTDTWRLDIAAVSDPATGVVACRIDTIDPATGLPPSDPHAGFLGIEDGTGAGTVHLTFEVAIRDDASEDTAVVNQASVLAGGFAADTNAVYNTVGAPAWLPADVDGSGGVDARDLQMAINAVLGRPVDPGCDPDVNGDGALDALDIEIVLSHLLAP